MEILPVRRLAIAGMLLFISACAVSPASVLKGQGSWSSFQHDENSRSGEAAVVMHDGRVLLLGGNLRNGRPVATVEIYDPHHATWSTATDMPVAVNFPSVTVMADGRVLVAGGWVLKANTVVPVNTAFIFDPASGSWTKVAPMTQSRSMQSAVLLRDGRVLVAGGANASTEITSSEIFNPATGKWMKAANMPVDRGSALAITLPDGRVFVTGGFSSAGSPPSSLYDPGANAWSTLKFPPTGYVVSSAFLNRAGQIVGFMHQYQAPPNGESVPAPVDLIPFVFDLQTGVTRTGTAMPGGPSVTAFGPSGRDAVLMLDGKLLNFDGIRVLLYDPVGNNWTVAPSPPPISGIFGPTLIMLQDGRVLITSGDYFDLFDPNGVIVGPSPAFIGSPELSWWLTVIAALMIVLVGAQYAWSRRPQRAT
jgi:hypothetical protein